jgi:hypothetical protein
MWRRLLGFEWGADSTRVLRSYFMGGSSSSHDPFFSRIYIS